MDTNVVSVGDYAGLRRAIRDFVRGGVEHGVIRVQQYAGESLEEDLAAAAYSVAREDPAGAYAVDYMTHECTLIVSYYEIHVDITFRKTQTALADIPYVSGQAELERRLHEAMDSYDSVLTIYAGFEQEPDYAALAQEYYEENLGRLMALPQITVENYPQGGSAHCGADAFLPTAGADAREHGAAGGGHHPRGLGLRPLPREPVGKDAASVFLSH